MDLSPVKFYAQSTGLTYLTWSWPWRVVSKTLSPSPHTTNNQVRGRIGLKEVFTKICKFFPLKTQEFYILPGACS